MLQDVFGSLLAVLAFAAVLYAPGYVVAFATDLFGFRKMSFPDRSTWAIAASFCIMPIAAYLVGRSAGLHAIPWLCGGFTVATSLLLTRKGSFSGWSTRDRWITACILCGWVTLVLLLLVDLQVGKKLYFSVVMADESYRIAFTDAVVRTGVPPANPLYFAGSPAPMRYYYFWYVLCAAVVKIAHVSARQAFIASSVWAGFGLLATVHLYTRYFFHWGRKQRWIALGLLLVTGADLLPAVGQAVLQPSLNGDTEWWSVDPIDAWPDSLLWVPHHVASVLCCLLAFLLVWRTMEELTRNARRPAIVLAATAFASALGLSVYVAFGFAVLLAAWTVRLAVVRDVHRAVWWRRVATAGVLSALLLLPFLHELAAGSAASAGQSMSPAPAPFTLSVRRMIDSELLTGLPALAPWHAAHPQLLDQAVRLALLLPGLAMELGLYGVVLVMLLASRRRGHGPAPDAARDTSLFFAVCGLAMTMFLGSSVITNNDFGYRAVMLPQFFLLLLAADVLGSWWLPGHSATVPLTPGKRRLVYAMLVVGAIGSLYWAFLLRAWLPLEAGKPGSGFGPSPGDNYEIREAFDTLNKTAPTNAVISFHPIDPVPNREGAVMVPNEYYQRMLVMDAGRQLLNAEDKCAVHFGGNPGACTAIHNATKQLYATPTSPDTAWAREYCRSFGVSYLVLSAWDPGWRSTAGWPVTLPVVAAEPRFRIMACQ